MLESIAVLGQEQDSYSLAQVRAAGLGRATPATNTNTNTSLARVALGVTARQSAGGNTEFLNPSAMLLLLMP